MNRKFTDLKIQQEEAAHDCITNYENSETNLTHFKRYIETTKVEFETRLVWAQEASKNFYKLQQDYY